MEICSGYYPFILLCPVSGHRMQSLAILGRLHPEQVTSLLFQGCTDKLTPKGQFRVTNKAVKKKCFRSVRGSRNA